MKNKDQDLKDALSRYNQRRSTAVGVNDIPDEGERTADDEWEASGFHTLPNRVQSEDGNDFESYSDEDKRVTDEILESVDLMKKKYLKK